MADPASALRIAEHIVTLLDQGAYESTYKHAVLAAMLDLCLERTDRVGHPPDSITTRQLAEKVIALYWPQTRPWGQGGDRGILAQSSQGKRELGGAKIVRRIVELRRVYEAGSGERSRLDRVKQARPDDYERLVRVVERTLILMPLPKLQRVGGEDTGWLYAINWDDGAAAPAPRTLTAYLSGRCTGFDNQIRFKPGVPEALVRLHGILRPFVEHRWAGKVAAINDLDERQLPGFLFGCDRTSLTPVRAPLVELQRGVCFYCDRPMRAATAHVDHFIPWARRADNGLHNLVATHGRCNLAKRDFLAGVGHVERWRARAVDQSVALSQIAAELCWGTGEHRIVGVARALYLGLPDNARLWLAANDFEQPDAPALRAALSA